jgi:hypothetical protein
MTGVRGCGRGGVGGGGYWRSRSGEDGEMLGERMGGSRLGSESLVGTAGVKAVGAEVSSR